MMQGVENWVGSIVFLLAVLFVLPIIALLSPSKKEGPPLPAAKDAPPLAYCALGAVLSLAALVIGGIVAWGFLFPGLGWIPANQLSALEILIPGGSTRRWDRAPRPSARLELQDTEMSFFISAIAFGFLVIGLFLLVRGARGLRASRSA